MTKSLSQPTEAESIALQTQQEVKRLVSLTQFSFLKIGELLYKAREERHYQYFHTDWLGYLKDLELPVQNPYSWASNVIGVYEQIYLKLNKKPEEMAQMGITKLIRLIPAARKDKLTDDLWTKAQTLSDLDLRREVGHKIGDVDTSLSIICPNCGSEVLGAKWAKGIYAEKIPERGEK